MGVPKDYTGMRYSRLLVIRRVSSEFWLCQCDCGNEKAIRISSLRGRNTKSCGCWHLEYRKLPPGVSAMKRTIERMMYSAKTRRIEWLLPDDIVQHLMKQDCFYCGAPPSNTCTSNTNSGSFRYTGIDRLDSNGPYRFDNVVPCCVKCNTAKMKMGVAEFAAWIRRAFEHFAKPAQRSAQAV